MRLAFFLLFATITFSIKGQPPVTPKKYPSLFWEITGKGLNKPSYLFGTMHVSSKIAFHLSDSFYLGIRNADVVALETNPESWQEDLVRYELGNNPMPGRRSTGFPSDYMREASFRVEPYEKYLEHALYSSPSTINNLLYRSYETSGDFEEDTYLDMYIYQVGKKWGKKVAGVERYDESMQLMMEAYRDAAREKDEVKRSYDYDDEFSPEKLQEAYRQGNLDLLDSITKRNSFSDAFDEKFLYRRNEIQAESIDSILKTKQSLFVGVGAAHLPGHRGVIELLRQAGYKLRPIMMVERDNENKELVDKLRVPVSFNHHKSDDGFYELELPGKFYRFYDYAGAPDQEQYADMANGSYYMVTRVKTHTGLFGHTPKKVLEKVDSLLYENVPGKILEKKLIRQNGFEGFDITNRTRRGDMQRYRIFVTPFETIVFKMSGTGDYVKNGPEADRFFNSIRLNELPETNWQQYHSPEAGFTVDLPHSPHVTDMGNRIYKAIDTDRNLSFIIFKQELHNYHFTEEDAFDLMLMEQSFASSEIIEKCIDEKTLVHDGYPAMECSYRHKDGSYSKVRYIIRGPHYYLLVVSGKKKSPQMAKFMNSFSFTPFEYEEPEYYHDSLLKFTVTAPVVNEQKEKISLPDYRQMLEVEEEKENGDVAGIYKSRMISSRETGEKIMVSYYQLPRYYEPEDSIEFIEATEKGFLNEEAGFEIKWKQTKKHDDGSTITEYFAGAEKSSRLLHVKSFYRSGKFHVLMTLRDSIAEPGAFVTNFFNSFQPADSVLGQNPFSSKANRFFSDMNGGDSVERKRAISQLSEVSFRNEDLKSLRDLIGSLSWEDENYLSLKKSLIFAVGKLDSPESAVYLKNIFLQAGDTVDLQYAALSALLRQSTTDSYREFGDLLANETPVLNAGSSNNYDPYEHFLYRVDDSLELARQILPDLLPLMTLDDYESDIMDLLADLTDSSLIKADAYAEYLEKFILESRQAWKRQAIEERSRSIEREKEVRDGESDADFIAGEGNEDLMRYARLLLPFRNTNEDAATLILNMLGSDDNKLKYETVLLLLRKSEPIPDTILYYLASMDEFRFRLYEDLYELEKEKLFPASYNKHTEIARSQLYTLQRYNKPDSIVYLTRLPLEHLDRKGWVYFFKYKDDKTDVSWKIAAAGLIPEDEDSYYFPEKRKEILENSNENDPYDLTTVSDTILRPDQPEKEQLEKLLLRLWQSNRKSGLYFYAGE